MHAILSLLALATGPSATIPEGSPSDSEFIWVDEEAIWNELPDPDPERILPPIKRLRTGGIETRQSQPASALSKLRSAAEAERKADEAIRRAEEAVAKAHATVRAAEDKSQ